MLLARVVNGRAHGRLEYAAAALMSGGAVGFAWQNTTIAARDTASGAGVGAALLACSVCCDALVVNAQERVLATVDGLRADQLVANTNVVAAAAAAAYLVATVDLPRLCAAMSAQLACALAVVGMCLGVSVLAYTRFIECSSASTAVTVATLRKVLTVLLSYVFFPKPLLKRHVLSGAAVLAGIALAKAARRHKR